MNNPLQLINVPKLYDYFLIIIIACLLAIGVLMIASASMAVATKQYHQPFYFLIRQLLFLGIGFIAALFVLRIPLSWLQKMGFPLIILAIVLLIAVLIPGIGHSVNGSRRWLHLPLLNFQVSEYVKLAMIIFLAGFLVRRQEEVRTKLSGFVKPMVVYGILAVLLLLEPDFGATAVIGCTVLAMMFLAGMRLWQFALLILFALLVFGILAISAPYRVARLTTFLNPWANAFGSGYQLTQSLIAFGRGGWFGLGLGNSVQKLFYLPEAHTDFLFAVLAEELGLIAVLILIALYALLIWRILVIGRRAAKKNELFSAYICYGVAVWFALQVFVNMGVNAGMLPTKGLTLPLISYGGSSLLINCITLAIILRIDYETRLKSDASLSVY
jgi:cell division protein FtsW